MTTKDAKEYMNRLEIPQLFESMLTGLLYNKPEDHLQFLGDCINSAKNIPNLKWDTFLDHSKKPLPAIPKTTDGPIRSESFGLSDEAVFATFETEPVLQMKLQTKLPAINMSNSEQDDVVDDANSLINESFTKDDYTRVPVKQNLFKGQTVIFVLGGPGSGKGTQCLKIVEYFGLTHLSVGELLRNEVKKNSNRSTFIAEFIKDGKIVPWEITIELLKDAMLQHTESPGFLIDGFPRELDQGYQFEQDVTECDFVLFFECSEEMMEDRLLKRGETSGRSDDNADTIKKRLETFMKKTLPVVQYYESINKLNRVDACDDINKVFQSVCKVFDTAGILPRERTTEPSEATAKKSRAINFKSQRILFVLGGPGSGKGTQCSKIVEKFCYTHLSTGDLLREELNKDTGRAKMMSEMMKNGKLVPQEIIIELLKDAMLQYPQSSGFLIDGFPRELGQAKQFENELCQCDQVVFFECTEEVMEQRLLKRGETSGRADDNSETIKKRFKTYIEKTLPVIQYYETLDRVRKIDATRNVDEVFEDVCQIFHNLQLADNDNVDVAYFSNDNELKDAVNDLFNHMEQHEEENYSTFNRERNEEPVKEPVITAEESVPLGDLKTTLPTQSSLLNARVIFVIGGPGCGKGTQCTKIVESFNYTHLSTGNLLRCEVSSGSPRGQELSVIMERGELVPMKTVLEILRDAIIKQSNTKGFLIDGFPRELEQAVEFEREIALCDCVLYFECSSETMTSRLLKRAESSDRVDDNEETIKKRLETFFSQTLPVVQYYEEKGNIHKIAAEGNPEEIFLTVKGIFDALPQSE